VEVAPLEAYIERLPVNTNHLSKRMKEALLRAYRGSCAGCRATLGLKQASFDHTLRRGDGGRASLTNMQPICLGCKAVKDHDEQINGSREPICFTYDFPLRPAPSIHDAAFW
jgi:hypothetical protein